MARFEVTGPDGARYEVNGPDGATEQDAIAFIQKGGPAQPQGDRVPATQGNRDYGINFEAPDEEIRSLIGQLPETEKKRAHDLWADHRVTKIYSGTGFTPKVGLASGIPLIGPYLDEAAAGVEGLVHDVTGLGRPYDEAVATRRAHDRAAAAANPVDTTVGKLAAGIATGGPVVARLAPAATTLGRAGQGIAIGAPVGLVEGFGAGEGTVENRVDTAVDQAVGGGAIGAAIPVAGAAASRLYAGASNAVGPTLTRLRHGADEAADDILARRISAEGTTPAGKRLDLQQGQAQTARLNTNSRAELPETIADTSDAMRRLLGSLYRQGGEAGNNIKAVLERRQRGPENPYGPLPAGAPDGQHARVLDATERALLVRSADSARQTERQIMAQQAREGKRLYDEARNNSEAFDIQPVLDALALQAQQYPGQMRSRLLRALGLFRDDTPQRMAVNNVARFDASKQALDDMIDTAQRQGSGNLVRELTQFKHALLDKVHMPDASGAATINRVYREARETWGTAAENRNAIELGRAALRENAEISAEQYRELTRGQQQLFRIGFLESLRNALGPKTPGNDITQLFQQQRVRELMGEIIPTPRGRSAVFANRPERFGDLMSREQRMVQTRNEVLGNSKTAQRGQDDADFAGDALSNMVSRFRSSPTLLNMGIEATASVVRKVFGYRQDVAQALAQRLLETNPQTRNQILRRLARRGGPDRFARFADQLDRSNNALIAASAGPAQLEDAR